VLIDALLGVGEQSPLQRGSGASSATDVVEFGNAVPQRSMNKLLKSQLHFLASAR
jgi:hypothetical protein